MERRGRSHHELVMHRTLFALALSACAVSHPPPCAAPDGGAADGGALDAPTPIDAGAPDAPDTPERCEPPLVDEGDACIGWRAIPPPPCAPLALVRHDDGFVAVRCEGPLDAILLSSYAWEWSEPSGTAIEPETGGPPMPFPETIVVTLPFGTRVATHGDVYAHPAAWRTDGDGTWRETLPPPSAFVGFGAALSLDEALFVGEAAYVYVYRSHTPIGW